MIIEKFHIFRIALLAIYQIFSIEFACILLVNTENSGYKKIKKMLLGQPNKGLLLQFSLFVLKDCPYDDDCVSL